MHIFLRYRLFGRCNIFQGVYDLGGGKPMFEVGGCLSVGGYVFVVFRVLIVVLGG
jgi:hypothetical protein